MARLQQWITYISIALILSGVIVLLRILPTQRVLSLLAVYLEQWGAWGAVAFGVLYVIAVLAFVPGSAMTLAVGAIFGLLWSTVIVSLASTTAAAAAFLIARYIARGAIERKARDYPKFRAIDRAIAEGGWKIVALLRLSPAVPFSIGNYLFGLTAVRFWPYVLSSWIAMLPGTFLYVYLGYIGRAGLTAGKEGHTRSPAEWAMLVVGLLATIAVTVYVTRLARRAIQEQARDIEQEESEMSSGISIAPAAGRGQVAWRAWASAAVAVLIWIGVGLAFAQRDALASLLGPLPVKMTETYAEKPGGPTFDHSMWNAVLSRHVRDGWVNYQALAKESSGLDAYLASVAHAPFDDMGRSEKLALLLNAYNAFTLRLILDHYPVKSIMDIVAAERWDAKRWNVGGHTWSLNQIEHEQIRPRFREARVHFALVCAAVGCPPLRSEPYTAAPLDEQLNDQAVYVHSHSRWFQFDADKNIAHLTSIYRWYGTDFKQVAGSALAFAAEYSPPLMQRLVAGKKPKVEYLKYDWSLNSQENAR